MANNISKDILAPENGTETTSAADVVTPNPVVSETQPVPSPALAIPLPQEVLALHEAERRRKQIDAYGLRGDVPQPAPDAWKKTIGLFKEDPVMKEIAEEGRRIRESQRPE